eukprot:332288_1
MTYCSFYDIMICDSYLIENLLDDYHHLICNHKLEDTYNELKIRCDHIETCVCIKRTYRERSLCDGHSVYSGVNINEINVEQIMDSIHCYFEHSFDLNLMFTENEMDCINNYYQNDEEQKEIQYMNGDTLNIQIMQEIINNKKKKYNICITNDKFVTQIQNNSNLIHQFGRKYDYYNKRDACYVSAKYKTLQNELVNGLMKKLQFNVLLIRAEHMKNKQHSKLYTAEYNNYGIEYLSSVTIEHLLSLMVYCNYKHIRKLLCKTYITLKTNKHNKLHAKYVNLSKHLFEIVQVFGTHTKNDDVFYHCIDNPMICFASEIYTSSPLSTTNKIEVILTNGIKSEGIIIELKHENIYFEMKHFPCQYLSDFSGENELLFNGNQHMIHTFVYTKIIDRHSGRDYSKYVESIAIINHIFSGEIYKNMDCINSFIISTINNLLRNQLNTNIITDINIPDYVRELMQLYLCDITIIKINWFHIIEYYNFIKSIVCFNHFINLNVLLKLFKNTTNIFIDGGNKLILNGIIMDYIYLYLQSEDRNTLKLKKIEIKQISKSSLSFFLLLPLYKTKFA